MATYYAERALNILREEGIIELYRKFSRFIFRHPMGLLDPQCRRRFKFHTWKNHLQNRIRYDAPPDPYNTIQIRPSNIDYRVGYTHRMRTVQRVRYKGIAQTKSGNWDKNRVAVNDSFIIKGIQERFGEGKNWENTKYYNYVREKFAKDNTKYTEIGFNCLDGYLQENFNSVEELFNKIKYGGYKSNHDGQHVRPGSTQPIRDKLEVLVTIDRNGEINFFEGNHRFGIARVLDIEIPVHVVCRHNQWQELRDDIYNNGLTEGHEELHDHPDLQDVLN
ncbi:hypothetical protein [Natrarchaeobius chitinivorans]|uniref:hypothetical protein n=1 Tax=Natrarchaeobius chitinivorans TaxID=1679083 RepID=UPI001404AE6D|nr:hypothetical protein [Natrarchaeobius chitinivorans]